MVGNRDARVADSFRLMPLHAQARVGVTKRLDGLRYIGLDHERVDTILTTTDALLLIKAEDCRLIYIEYPSLALSACLSVSGPLCLSVRLTSFFSRFVSINVVLLTLILDSKIVVYNEYSYAYL